MKLNDAMTTLQVRMAAHAEEAEAIEWLARRCATLEEALAYYAKPANYIDGVPLHEHPHTGLLTIEDNGVRAQQALGDDFPLGRPLIVIAAVPAEERLM